MQQQQITFCSFSEKFGLSQSTPYFSTADGDDDAPINANSFSVKNHSSAEIACSHLITYTHTRRWCWRIFHEFALIFREMDVVVLVLLTAPLWLDRRCLRARTNATFLRRVTRTERKTTKISLWRARTQTKGRKSWQQERFILSLPFFLSVDVCLRSLSLLSRFSFSFVFSLSLFLSLTCCVIIQVNEEEHVCT